MLSVELMIILETIRLSNLIHFANLDIRVGYKYLFNKFRKYNVHVSFQKCFYILQIYCKRRNFIILWAGVQPEFKSYQSLHCLLM